MLGPNERSYVRKGGAVDSLSILAKLLAKRNVIDEQISRVIGRPATTGHIGEFIAALIFDIELFESANNRAADGIFRSGPFRGKSVDVKFYGKQEGLLAVQQVLQPDYFLVLAGPRGPATSSRGSSRLLVIDHVYLFEGKSLADDVRRRHGKFSVAVGFRASMWEAAEIFPTPRNDLYCLSDGQRALIAAFASKKHR